MEKFANFQEDLSLLIEAGLVAVKQGDEDSARKLFHAVNILDPKNNAYKVGMGLIALNKMDLPNARKYFKEAIEQDPSDHRASAFLGFSYMLTAFEEDKSEEDKLKNLRIGTEIAIKVAQEKNVAPDAKRLADSLLEWEKEIEQKVDVLNNI